jgi:hypothetical protein
LVRDTNPNIRSARNMTHHGDNAPSFTEFLILPD